MKEASVENPSMCRGGVRVTQQQADVVDHLLRHSVTVVSAGAGSGKTYTTVAALMELLEKESTTLDRCILITFTNKAANELRHRIEQALLVRKNAASSAQERQKWYAQLERLNAAFLGTIHSFCSQLIRLYGYKQAVAREAEVTFANMLCVEAEKDALEHHTQTELPERYLFGSQPKSLREYELREILDKILSHIRNQGIKPEELIAWTEAQPDDDGHKPKRMAMARVVEDAHCRYQRAKELENLLDSHDLLQRAADLLSPPSEEIRKRIGRRYQYLFIDEFQDTDQVQKQIVDALLPHLKGTLVVGDNKQSIYAFRGANVRLLHQLAEENGVKVLPLNISRRPTVPFLEVQNELFRSMGQRFPELDAPLEPYEGTHEPTQGPPPLLYVSAGGSYAALEDRIHSTAEVLQRDLLNQSIHLPEIGIVPIQPGHIVILARSNFMVQRYAQGLQRLGFPVVTDTGESFYTQPEVVATYRMLRLLLHYPDDAVLSMALETPYLRMVDIRKQERNKIQYSMEGSPLVDELEEEYPDVHGYLKELRQKVRTDTVSQIMGRLYEQFGIQDYYRQNQNLRGLRNLERLREKARALFDEEQALTLRQFVDWLQIAILSDRDEPAIQYSSEEALPSAIRVMTIHRAKGLEFPIVILPEAQKDITQEQTPPPFLVTPSLGLEVNFFSPRESQTQTTLSDRFWAERRRQQQRLVQEEMRILYVAVTRAQHSVVLIGSGRTQPNSPRQFPYAWLDELLYARSSLLALPHGVQFRLT